ncbi:MAG: hypothetical protein KAG66_23740, partial [Methylococcales bacterium]|nr:hypothetical protein [Methylococcales bacterium]
MLNGKLIASRVSGHPIAAQNELFYLLTDHLGSVVQTVKDDGTAVGNVIRYNPFGGYRAAPTSEQDDVSDRGYTGHYDNDDLGLVYMNARYYLPNTNRFISADTIVPDPTNPQSLNRYTYVYNNPLRFTDPSGHGICNPADNCRNQTPSRTLPNNKPDGLKEDGKNAWNGLQSIQDYHDAWWDTDLNPTEAMVIALQEEFGYGNRLGQRTTDALANRFNAFCGGGVWSGDCVQAFWGYMQPIREPDWADMLEHPIYSNPEAMS